MNEFSIEDLKTIKTCVATTSMNFDGKASKASGKIKTAYREKATNLRRICRTLASVIKARERNTPDN